MQISKLSAIGGISVEGIDLAAPRSVQEDHKLRQLLDEHGLVVFRNQKLTKQQLIAAGDPFGGTVLKREGAAMDDDAPGVITISTRGHNGKIMPENPDNIIGNSDWHTDDGFVTNPCRGKILYAVAVPEEGGMTGFIDGAMAYSTMPESLRARVEGRHVIQDWDKCQAYMGNNRAYANKAAEMVKTNRFNKMAYALVHTHPVTGVKVLNCPPLWATGVEELPGKEGENLVDEVCAHLLQEKFQYWHKYNVGDAVLWDNWRFLHAAGGTIGRYVRTIWSITLNNGPALAREITRDAA